MSGLVDASRSSVVAYYGDPPAVLAALVERLQAAVGRRVGAGFVARPITEVHATIIGLEHVRAAGRRPYPARPLLQHLVRTFTEHPLQLQFGGFAAADRRLLRRGSTLHERTVTTGPAGLVLIGWPVRDGPDGPLPLPALAEIRRGCEEFGVRHRYHLDGAPDDPDAYLVIGGIGDVDSPTLAAGLHELRRELATAPVRVPLGVPDLCLVEYRHPTLSLHDTRRIPVVEF